MANRPIIPCQTTRRSDAVQGRRTTYARRSNRRNFIVRASALALLLLGCAAQAASAARSFSSPPIIRNVRILQEGDRVPGTTFTDQNGKPFSLTGLRGREVVLSFIYTRCHDPRECPLISAKFGRLQAALRNDRTHLVEITLDPQYDRPAVLRKYAALFGADAARWSIGTGAPDAVLDFAARFGVQPLEDARGSFIHNERMILIDAAGVIRYASDDAGWNPAGILAELRALQGGAGNPLARLDLALSRAAVAICGNAVAGFSGLADLAAFLLILCAFGWGFYRIGLAIRRGT